jgi:acetamidase/formamidase
VFSAIRKELVNTIKKAIPFLTARENIKSASAQLLCAVAADNRGKILVIVEKESNAIVLTIAKLNPILAADSGPSTWKSIIVMA